MCGSLCSCLCVCVCEGMRVCVCKNVCVRVCVCSSVCVRVCANVCVGVWVRRHNRDVGCIHERRVASHCGGACGVSHPTGTLQNTTCDPSAERSHNERRHDLRKTTWSPKHYMIYWARGGSAAPIIESCPRLIATIVSRYADCHPSNSNRHVNMWINQQIQSTRKHVKMCSRDMFEARSPEQHSRLDINSPTKDLISVTIEKPLWWVFCLGLCVLAHTITING